MEVFTALNHGGGLVGTVLFWAVAILVAAFLTKLIANIAIGGPTRKLNDELDELNARRAEQAKLSSASREVIKERQRFIKSLEVADGNYKHSD